MVNTVREIERRGCACVCEREREQQKTGERKDGCCECWNRLIPGLSEAQNRKSCSLVRENGTI